MNRKVVSTFQNLFYLGNNNWTGVVDRVMPGGVLSVCDGSGDAQSQETGQVNSTTFSGGHFNRNRQRRIVFGQNDRDVEDETDVGKRRRGVE